LDFIFANAPPEHFIFFYFLGLLKLFRFGDVANQHNQTRVDDVIAGRCVRLAFGSRGRYQAALYLLAGD
jgi:hypothetical protein|tara:strand:+ start:11175 stop:11381 length:207 start_codon:yes stop_codon:yes gene_type:complete